MPWDDVFAGMDGQVASQGSKKSGKTSGRAGSEENSGKSPSDEKESSGHAPEAFCCLRSFRLGGFLSVFPPTLDNEIQHRDEEKIQHRRHNHAAEHGCAHGVTAILTRARGEDKGHDA